MSSKFHQRPQTNAYQSEYRGEEEIVSIRSWSDGARCRHFLSKIIIFWSHLGVYLFEAFFDFFDFFHFFIIVLFFACVSLQFLSKRFFPFGKVERYTSVSVGRDTNQTKVAEFIMLILRPLRWQQPKMRQYEIVISVVGTPSTQLLLPSPPPPLSPPHTSPPLSLHPLSSSLPHSPTTTSHGQYSHTRVCCLW